MQVLARGFYHWDWSPMRWRLYDLWEEQWLLQELYLAMDQVLRQPPVLVEHWGAGMSASSMGEG